MSSVAVAGTGGIGRVPDNAVARVSAVLNCFGVDAERLGVCEIARRSGLPKSTASRLIADMVRHGLLERHEGVIGVGARLFELGQHVTWKRALRDVALHPDGGLRSATRQTVHLAVMDGIEVLYVEIIRGAEGPAMPSESVVGSCPCLRRGQGDARVLSEAAGGRDRGSGNDSDRSSDPHLAADPDATARRGPGRGRGLRARGVRSGCRLRGVPGPGRRRPTDRRPIGVGMERSDEAGSDGPGGAHRRIDRQGASRLMCLGRVSTRPTIEACAQRRWTSRPST